MTDVRMDMQHKMLLLFMFNVPGTSGGKPTEPLSSQTGNIHFLQHVQHEHELRPQRRPVDVRMLPLPALEDKYKRKALFRVYTAVSTMLLLPSSCISSHCFSYPRGQRGRQ